MTALTQRDAQRQHDNACDCCGDPRGAALDMIAADYSDGEIVDFIYEADVAHSMVLAAVFAVRNLDFDFLRNQYATLAGPVIQQAARDEAERLGEM